MCSGQQACTRGDELRVVSKGRLFLVVGATKGFVVGRTRTAVAATAAWLEEWSGWKERI